MQTLVAAVVVALAVAAALGFSAGPLWRPEVLLDRAAALALAAAVLAGCWGIGRAILRRIRAAHPDPAGPGAPDPSASLIAFGIGLAAAFGLLFVIGIAGALTPTAAWGLLAALAAVSFREVPGMARDLGCLARAASGTLSGRVALAVAALAIPAALAPPTAQDALVYHLAVPARWIAEGRIAYVPGNFFSGFPSNMELLFAWGLLLKGPDVAALLHAGAGILAATAAGVAILRLGGDRRAAALGSLAIISMPTVFHLAGGAYVDLGVVAVQLIAFLAYLGHREDPDRRRLIVAGLLCGAAAGIKYTAGIVALPIAIDLFLRRRALRGRWVADAAVLTISALLAFLPWAARNAIALGNPVYPFAHAFFGGAEWDAERASLLSRFLGGWGERSLVRLIELPYALALRSEFSSSEGFDGVIGPFFWIAAPLAVAGAVRIRAARPAFGFAAILLAAWLGLTWQIRFLLPALAFIVVGTCASLPHLAVRPGYRRAIGVAFGFAIAINIAVDGAMLADANPLAYAFGMESRDAYYLRALPGGDWPVFAAIERDLPQESRILMAACGNPGFLCARPYRSDALFENWTLARLLAGAPDPAALEARIREEGFTHVLFRLPLVFGEPGRRSDLSIAEQRAFAAFLEARCERIAEASGTVLYRIGRGR
ncbi:MAG: hypothetical protein JXP34_16040 [Planctomycetes bacterium]|nr:hypothetical protein [Planctomycetota bacterium]